MGAWTRLRVDAANESGGAVRSFLDVPLLWNPHFEEGSQRYQDYVAQILSMFGVTPESAANITALERRVWQVARRSNGRLVQPLQSRSLHQLSVESRMIFL